MEEGCGGDIVTEAVTGEDDDVHNNEGETLVAVSAAGSFNMTKMRRGDLMAEAAAGFELLMTDAVNIDEDEAMEE